MFLRGLNDSFSSIKSQIMMMTPFHDVERVFNILSHQERQMIQDLEKAKFFVNNVVIEKQKSEISPRGRILAILAATKPRRVEINLRRCAPTVVEMDTLWKFVLGNMAFLLTSRRTV
jgi:hypothetical protein